MTDRSITFKQKYQQLSTHKVAKESVYFTVSAHISTVCCLALLWAVHSVLTWWVLPCLWSPSSTVNKSWGLHRWRNTLLLYTRTRPYFLLYLLNFPSISHISHYIFKTTLLTNSIFTGEFFSYRFLHSNHDIARVERKRALEFLTKTVTNNQHASLNHSD